MEHRFTVPTQDSLFYMYSKLISVTRWDYLFAGVFRMEEVVYLFKL